MVRVALVGLGKMGLSHLSIIRAHPDVEVVGICDSSRFVLDLLAAQAGLTPYTDVSSMLERSRPHAVIVATPTHLHTDMVRAVLLAGAHVFCEKPLVLDPRDGAELTELATQRGLVTQVGYHNRYVGTFREAHRLVHLGAIGEVTNALAEAYGPVVVKPSGSTWRATGALGGGCLYDYAAHPVDLLTWYLGPATSARGSSLRTIFSSEVDDAVNATLDFDSGSVAGVSVNWSDGSQRKMTTSVTLWGTEGRLRVDRQELALFLSPSAKVPTGYDSGWTVKYTTELTPAPWFYVRGEEYSAQLADFVRRVKARELEGNCTFRSATVTDQALAMIRNDALAGGVGVPPEHAGVVSRPSRPGPRRAGLVAGRSRRSLRAEAKHVVGRGARRLVQWTLPRIAEIAARAKKRAEGARTP